MTEKSSVTTIRIGNGATCNGSVGGLSVSKNGISGSISNGSVQHHSSSGALHHHSSTHSESYSSSRVASAGYGGGSYHSYEESHSTRGTPIVGGTTYHYEGSRIASSPIVIRDTAHSAVIESGISSLTSNHGHRAVEHIEVVKLSSAEMFAEATRREKEEMQDLNERLSNYIGRVKELEEQNKHLVLALSEIRAKWGTKNSSFKSSFSESVVSVRDNRFAANKLRVAQDVRVSRISSKIVDFRARIEEYHRLTEYDRRKGPQCLIQIGDAENELAFLVKRMEMLKGEERAALKEQEGIRVELDGLLEQLDVVNAEKIAYQQHIASIRDEISFYRKVQEEEVRELNGLLVVAPADTKEFFRSELALAIRDIRKEYLLLATAGKAKLESWYQSKIAHMEMQQTKRVEVSSSHTEQVSKLQTGMSEISGRYSQLEEKNRSLEYEVMTLQKQIETDHFKYEQAMHEYDSMMIRMRTECATLVAELQSLLDSKVLLDGEIQIYRAMVHGEEKRVGVVVKKIEEHADQWEVATKTQFQTQAHGHVAIVQTEATGKFVVIANTSDYVEERIGGWRIKRVIDGLRELNYTFPSGYILRPRQKIRIFASGQGSAGADSLVFDSEGSWGMGANIVTSLYNVAGEEKAVYTQKTVVVQT